MYLLDIANGEMGLFNKNNTRVGTCEYCFYEKGIKILNIFVDKPYRRKRGATRFLLAMARKCQEKNGIYIYLDDVSGTPIYSHLGFHLVYEHDNEMIARASTLRRKCLEKLKCFAKTL